MNFRFCISIPILTLLLLVNPCFTQVNGIIEGYIVEASSGEPLLGANVLVQGTQLGAATDENGYYRIVGIPIGSHTMRITMIGYRTKLEKVNILPGRRARVNSFLTAAVLKLSESLTVTAERKETFGIAKPLSLVDERRLREVKSATTAEALREISGISLARPGGWGVKPIIEGLTDDRIVVLVDGARLNQACPMGMDACVATINPDEIKRIEVIKGPHSVVHGSGNMGGVINIITRQSSQERSGSLKLTPKVSMGYHSVSTAATGRFSIEGALGGIDFSAASGLQRFGDYATPTGTVTNSGFSSRDLYFATGWTFHRGQRLQISAQQYDGKDIGYPATSAVIPHEKRRQYTLTYSAKSPSRSIPSLTATVSRQSLSHGMEVHVSGGESIFQGESNSDTYTASLKGSVVLSPDVSLVGGFDYYRWYMDASGGTQKQGPDLLLISTLPNAQQWDAGVFVEGKAAVSHGLDLTLGFRADLVKASADLAEQGAEVGRTSTVVNQFMGGNLGLLYRLSRWVNLTASLGRAFKPPTPVERYLSSPMADGYQRVGTPGLRSEKSHSARLGIKGRYRLIQWAAAIFQNSLTDFISPRVDTGSELPDSGLRGMKRYVNLGTATVRGLESSWSLAVTRALGLSGTVTYSWGELQSSDDQPLPRIPPLETDIVVRYGYHRFWAEVSGRTVATQERFNIQAGEVRTPGFVVFSMRAGVGIGQDGQLTFGVENILDRAYREHLNLGQLPEPGRNIYIGVDVGFPQLSSTFDRFRRPGSERSRVILRAGGIYCIYCQRRVEHILTKIDGVESVEVDLAEEEVKVEFDQGKAPIQVLLDALNNAGYEASLIDGP